MTVADLSKARRRAADAVPETPEWMGKLRTGGKGARIKDEENVRIVLEHDPALDGLVRYDVFASNMVLIKAIPGTVEGRRLPAIWEDTDTTALVQYIQRSSMSGIGRDKVESAVAQYAQETGSYHPVKEYLEGVQWDGVKRVDDWITTYMGAQTAPKQYVQAVGAAVLVGAVARIYQPGCKNDYAMVLEGVQGAKKSSLARTLATNDEWFSDSLPSDLGSKDARDHLRGKWIIELGELAALRKTEVEAVKVFITRQSEQYRPSYGRHEKRFPRQCIFIGSTNESEYLLDSTGNRRFWPLLCQQIDLVNLKKDVDQLWAEAVARYKSGAKWYLDDDVEKLAAKEVSAREVDDPWLPLVYHAIAWGDAVDTPLIMTPGEVLEAMDVDPSQRHSKNAGRVGKMLVMNFGFKRGKRDRLRGQLFELEPALSPEQIQLRKHLRDTYQARQWARASAAAEESRS